jgi:hypothetical protein
MFMGRPGLGTGGWGETGAAGYNELIMKTHRRILNNEKDFWKRLVISRAPG